jgi:hypothetical protein
LEVEWDDSLEFALTGKDGGHRAREDQKVCCASTGAGNDAAALHLLPAPWEFRFAHRFVAAMLQHHHRKKRKKERRKNELINRSLILVTVRARVAIINFRIRRVCKY